MLMRIPYLLRWTKKGGWQRFVLGSARWDIGRLPRQNKEEICNLDQTGEFLHE